MQNIVDLTGTLESIKIHYEICTEIHNLPYTANRYCGLIATWQWSRSGGIQGPGILKEHQHTISFDIKIKPVSIV